MFMSPSCGERYCLITMIHRDPFTLYCPLVEILVDIPDFSWIVFSGKRGGAFFLKAMGSTLEVASS